jgi:hypothetical protein
MVLDAVCALVLATLGALVVIRMAAGVRATRITAVAGG